MVTTDKYKVEILVLWAFMKSKLLIKSMLFTTLILIHVIAMSKISYQIVHIWGVIYEDISIDLDCTTGTLDVKCTIGSLDSEYVSFPSEVNMYDSRLQKCLDIFATFNETSSSLLYRFNETTTEEATTYANAITPSMNSAFDLTFDRQDTQLDSYRDLPPAMLVSYIAPSIPDMAGFTSNLKPKCLKPDIRGFSDILVSTVTESSQSTVELQARRTGFVWLYNFIVGYTIDMSPGEDPHIIDVLDLLGVSDLAPSPYSFNSYWGSYADTSLDININSPWNITYISCEPSEATVTGKGWWIYPDENNLGTSFDFYDDPTPVDSLSITFGGKVVPEFTSFIMILVFIGLTALILVLKRLHACLLRW